MADSHSLARSAGLTGLATLASRLLGLAREQVLAWIFGAGNEMDAFVVAFRIPNLVRDLFAEGAMSAAFIPTFTRQLTLRGREEAWRLGANVLTVIAVATGVLVAAGMIVSGPLVAAFAGEFDQVPGKLELTTNLTRVMLPFLTTVAAAAVLMGMLNSLHYYFVPALAPAAFNVAMLAGALVLVPLMPALGQPGIVAVAAAALAGGVLQVAVQWPPLRREGFRYRPSVDLRDSGMRQVLLLMGPGTIGLAATQVNLFVNTLLATGQGTGAVSWLSYAFRLMYLPLGLFGISIATAALPGVSRRAAEDDAAGVRRTVSQALAMMLVLNVPATFGLLILADPVVELLFERGRFLATDTAATAAAVRLYAVGLVGYASTRIVSPIFYTLGRSRVPVVVSVCTIGLNIVLNVTLVRIMGFRGLALGTSLAMLLNGGVLVLLLRRALHGIEGVRLMATFAKTLAAAVAMAVAASLVDHLMAALIPGDAAAIRALRVASAIGGALLVLALGARLLRISEFDEARRTIVRRLLARSAV